MAGSSAYPGALDDFAAVSPTSLGDNDTSTRKHTKRHDDVEAAMEAVQAELGTDPAGSFSTVKDRLTGADAGDVEVNIVAASGSAQTLSSTRLMNDVTMNQNCTFTFPTVTGSKVFLLILRGPFTATFPASVAWTAGGAPLYSNPSMYTFTTTNSGTTWLGTQVGRGYA